MHIVTNDYNLETHHIEWCLSNVNLYGSDDASEQAQEIYAGLSLLVLGTEDECLSAIGLAHGDWQI